MLPIACRGHWNSYIANWLLPPINFGNKNNFIPNFRINFHPPELMHNIHFHLSMRIAMISVIDCFPKDLMIKRIIQSQRKDLIKNLKNLSFEVGWIDLNCYFVKNVLDVLKVCLIERIHSLNGHSIFIYRHFIHTFARRKPPAKKTLAKVEVFVVGNWIRKNRTFINSYFTIGVSSNCIPILNFCIVEPICEFDSSSTDLNQLHLRYYCLLIIIIVGHIQRSVVQNIRD